LQGQGRVEGPRLCRAAPATMIAPEFAFRHRETP